MNDNARIPFLSGVLKRPTVDATRYQSFEGLCLCFAFGSKTFPIYVKYAKTHHNRYYYQQQEPMSTVEQSLAFLYTQIEKITYKSLSPSSFAFLGQREEEITQEASDLRQESPTMDFQQGGLWEALSEITFDAKLIESLNRVWSNSVARNFQGQKALFARNYYSQRRCIRELEKSLSKNKQIPRECSTKCERITQIYQNQPIHIELSNDDLKSIKQGAISYPIIDNYVRILTISKVIPSRSYVLPDSFLERLIGEQEQQYVNEESIKANMRRNYNVLKHEITLNILELEYLIIPIAIENNYKCIIVQGIHRLNNLGGKSNILLCNLKQETCSQYIRAIRLLLEFQIEEKKVAKFTVRESILPAYSILLPRQPKAIDSGLYVLLYLEFLFAQKCRELQDLRNPQSRRKLHLFPRALAMRSRDQIHELFINLLRESNEESRVMLFVGFIDGRSRCSSESMLQLNYDQIEQREVQKYLILKGLKTIKEGEHERFENDLNYYLDSGVNYQQSLSS